MKLAALILVLANLAIFLWLRWALPPSASVEPGLAAAASVAHPLKILDAPGSGEACLLFSDGMDATQARARAASLRRQGYEARAVTRPQQQASGYWVLVTGFKDVDAARAAARALRKGGIKDSFVLSDERGGATLSLGLFRDLDHARKRAAHVRKLGFRPRVRERFRMASSWTVQVPASASARAAFAQRVSAGACRVPPGGRD